MAPPIWSGFIKLSLVSVPLKAYTATDSSGEVHLNQLHLSKRFSLGVWSRPAC